MSDNTQWLLQECPHGEVSREVFKARGSALPVSAPDQVLVGNIYLLAPPSMRLWMNEKESYFPPQPLDQVMMGITLGVVVQSNHPAFKPGTDVNGMGGG